MTAQDAGGILGLDHLTLAVADLAAATAAYATIFDQPASQSGTAKGLAWAAFALANTTLVLVAAPEATDGLARHLAAGPGLGALGFAVADPARAARLLERRGLPAEGPPRPWLGRSATTYAPGAARGLRLLTIAPAPPAASATRLDHAVIRSADPERTTALLAGRLGLELRLDRSNPAWGSRLLFFRCGDLVIEVSHDLAAGLGEAPDSLWGLTWGVADIAATHARLEAAGLAVSPLRVGRKPGTRIFTLRDAAAGAPTAFIGA